MANFKEFKQKINATIVPICKGKIYLESRKADYIDLAYLVQDEDCEYVFDFIEIAARNKEELADKILQEMYKRGFSTSALEFLSSNKYNLEYSFLSNDDWFLSNQVMVLVKGDITADNDFRRDDNFKGQWFSDSKESDLIVNIEQFEKIKEMKGYFKGQ